jgi:transcription initiation factor TFIID subunit 10
MSSERVDATGLPTGLPQLLQFLTENELTIPDELTRYLLRTVGVDMQDVRALRVISLASQRFVANVLSDAYVLRHQRHDKSRQGVKHIKAMGLSAEEPPVLTTEDVASVLADAGVHIQQQMYYIDAKEAS